MPLIKIVKIHDGQIGVWKINENDMKSASLNTNSSTYHPNVNTYKNNCKKMQVFAARLLANELYPHHQLKKNKYGKPFLDPDSFSISISNNEDLVVMIGSNEKCGIDIEFSDRKVLKIKEKFINKDDFSFNGNNEDLLWTWCAKESMYKIFGTPEIFFKEHLKIYALNSETLMGECCHEKYLFKCQLNKLKINNHFLVYTSKFELN